MIHAGGVQIRGAIERAAQIAVREHAEHAHVVIDDRGHAEALGGDFQQALGQRACRREPWGRASPVRITSFTYNRRRPRVPAGCERAKSSSVKPRAFEQRHRQRIAHRQRRRGAGGGRQVQRAGLRRHADVQVHGGDSRQRGTRDFR